MDCAVVVCIRRGHGNLPLKTPVINTMGSTDDLKIQLTHIKRKYPNSKILGVGISAGSGLLARYLGEVGAKSLLFAAVAISPAYDIEKAFHRIHPIYNKLMAQRLINYFLERHYLSLSEIPGYNHVKDSKSIGEFQDRLHLLSGYASKEEYYHYSNPIKVANLIQTPLLILNADDDPICVKLNVNENLHWLEGLTKTILVKTKRGSHIAFFEGFRARSWCDELVTDYFIEVLKT
ncbi:MAG: alpha/beta hydrolase, partial [Nanoarchaeota archaeon]